MNQEPVEKKRPTAKDWQKEPIARDLSGNDLEEQGQEAQRNAKVIGSLYFCSVMDALIELAYAVSMDFINRPHLYHNVPIADQLVNLRMCYGNSPNYPNAQQRQAIYSAIFGRSDALRQDATTSSFHGARKKLLDAALAFAERAHDTSVPMLTARVRSALLPISTHVKGIFGDSSKSSHQQIRQLFGEAVAILRCDEVARVFGVRAPDGEWPLSDNANGTKLVAAISSTLKLAGENSLAQDKFVFLQRVALEGRDALTHIYRANLQEAPTNELITSAYTWGAALRDYHN